MGIRRWTRPGIEHLHTAPTLLLSDVCATYDDGVLALDHVSLQIEAGEHVAVVGPNGAGKSTLFNLIAGTLSPRSGQVPICGHEPDRHTCIAYVPQRSQIDWSFPVTVEDVVMMGRVGQMGCCAVRASATGTSCATAWRAWTPCRWPKRRSARCPAGSSSAYSSRAPWPRRRSPC